MTCYNTPMKTIPKNTANILTVLRIVLVPVIAGLLLVPAAWAVWTAFILYGLCAFTDWLDGWIARKYDQYSDFGRFLDPIADKILVAALFIMLAATKAIPGIWLALPIIIMTREFLVAGLREYLGPKGVVVHVTQLAKWKTAVQMIALGILIPGMLYHGVAQAGLLLLLVATILTVITGWDYMKTARSHFKS
ncbi:CDP-diacylglycerol--glycerol-3-phosphate 3-phosphatidyltransferase [Micavibrio aeruginosavorus EPB]|uniref:CDP-diacylglycerol--glycerol-3-phosphate 3-phosphatidyltransferase n=2 Tax=Micavibrio aeruginosavorus TaxID=349221 RepID=M4VHH7_9BACT|nr:CDP-diacylglycerol--glycerol-3-phosphate 3-phosphatidyltransferase [Micavibrio aeruginosavorus EPB]